MVPLHWLGHTIHAAVWHMPAMQLSDFPLAVVTQGTPACRFLVLLSCLMELPLVIARRGGFVGCDPLQEAFGCW